MNRNARTLLAAGLAAALLLLLGLSCLPIVRPTPTPKAVQTVSVLYAGDIDWTSLPQFAALVKADRPAAAIVAGRLLADYRLNYLFQGEAECAALAASGVDAIRLTPEFLALGLKTAHRLADSVLPPAFLLSGNVWDSARQALFGPAYLRKNCVVAGGTVRLGLLGLSGEPASQFWNQPGIAWQAPDSAARLLATLRMTSDLVGVVADAKTAPGFLAGADFTIGSAGAPLPATASQVNRLELDLDAQNRISARRVVPVDLTRVSPDSTVLATVRRYERQVDSLLKSRINEARVELDGKTLNAVALKTAPSRAHAEGALFGNSLVLKPLGIGDITLARLFDITGAGNRLLKIDIEGQEFDKFPPRDEPGVGWRSILQQQRIMLRRQYSIVTTLDYVTGHPTLTPRRLSFLPLNLAEVFAYALRDRSKAKPDTLD
jgi:2',3'-cyclic-nucleotide 2'-phosphodiesterase (5'-nucleotidase family)